MQGSLFTLIFSLEGMKKFVLRIFIFITCLLVIDCIAGGIFPLLVEKAKGGIIGETTTSVMRQRMTYLYSVHRVPSTITTLR